MKIKKLQGGGFATFTPILPTMPTPAVKPEQTSDSGGNKSLLDKDIYEKLLSSRGLVNDVNAFVEAVQKMESSSAYPYLNGQNRTSAVAMIGKVNELMQSREYWNESLQNAKTSGGLGEVAVDDYKRMYVRDSDGLVKAISMDEYRKSKQKPKVLTVADLLTARQYDPQFVGNKSIFSIANESIGIDKVRDDIRDMMSLLSEASISSEKHYSRQQIMTQLRSLTGKTPTDDVLRGIQELNQLAQTPGDYFKVTSENVSKRKNIGVALNYIWKTLGRSAQNKLEAVAALGGEDNPTKLIYDMLLTYTEPKITEKITPEKETDVFGTAQDKTKKPLTVFQLFHKGKLASPNNNFAFNDPKLGVLFRGMISGVSPLITKEGEPVGMATLYNVFNNPKVGYGIFLDQQNASIGDKKISEFEQSQVIYDGKETGSMYMPVDANGNVDYQSLQEFKDLYAEYEQNKDSWTAEEASQFFRQNGYNLTIDERNDGTKIEKVIRDNSRVKPFYVMYGYTNDATNLTDGNEMFTSRLSNDEEKQILPFLKQIWTVGTGKNARDLTPNGWFGEDYYKVMITVPYKTGYAALVDAMVGQGPQESAVTMEQVAANLAGTQQKPSNSTSSGVLNNK